MFFFGTAYENIQNKICASLNICNYFSGRNIFPELTFIYARVGLVCGINVNLKSGTKIRYSHYVLFLHYKILYECINQNYNLVTI